MMTPAQLRAARALLGLSRKGCGLALGISPETIRNIEKGAFQPAKTTVEKLREGFAERGVLFIGREGVLLLNNGKQQSKAGG